LDKLVAAQQYLTRSLTRFEEELFPILYVNFNDQAESIADEVFGQGRSVCVYGVRGIGKN